MASQGKPIGQKRIGPSAAAFYPPRQDLLLIGFFGLFVLALLGPFMSYSELPGTGEGSPMRQGGYLIVFALTFLALKPWRDLRRLLVVPWPIIVALAWYWCSVTWALVPGVSLRRIVLTTVVIWTVFATVSQLGYAKPVAVLRVLLLALLIINIAVSLLYPEMGLHHINEPGDPNLIGDWRGIMTHKNFAGPPTVMLIYLMVFNAERIPRILRLVAIAAGCYFLFRCGSKTSVGIGVFGLAIGLLYQFLRGRLRPVFVILTFLAGMAASVAAYIYKNPLLGNFTDPTAFTARPLIWKALIQSWQQNPWTGTGIGSFWNIGPQSPIYHYATGWVTEVTIGHNGFLDLLAQTGIPGLVLALFATLVVPVYLLLFRRDDHSGAGALLLAILLFCIGHNATESSLFDRDAIPQVFLMFAIAQTYLRVRDSTQSSSRLFGEAG